MDTHWFADVDNVTHLGSALVEAGFDAKQLQRYYEKPWKWTDEWEALKRGQQRLEDVLDGNTEVA